MHCIQKFWLTHSIVVSSLNIWIFAEKVCCVGISIPLLKLRPRKDLVETLLHEMIHAYLFVTDNNDNHDGHGPEFHKHMYRINQATGILQIIFNRLLLKGWGGGGGEITHKNLKYVFKEQIYQFITRFMTKLLCINNTGGDVEDPAQSRDFL